MTADRTYKILEHEFLSFILHVGRDETGKVKRRAAVHQELVVHETVSSKGWLDAARGHKTSRRMVVGIPSGGTSRHLLLCHFVARHLAGCKSRAIYSSLHKGNE